MAPSYFGPRPLAMAPQVNLMRACFPQLVCAWRGDRATWTGPVAPVDLATRYTIRIEYIFREDPRVTVREPKLRRLPDGTPIPHIYPGELLCLYLPRSGEWNASMSLADTILPWTCLWLFYYEIWHATGVWMGGGEHPRPKILNRRRS